LRAAGVDVRDEDAVAVFYTEKFAGMEGRTINSSPDLDDANAVRVVDAMLRALAEEEGLATQMNISIENAVDASWQLLASGALRLIGDGSRLGVRPCPERHWAAQAERNRPLIEARYRMLAEQAGPPAEP
jgi:hypothetical protein